MSFAYIIYEILIRPLEILFEIIFSLGTRVTVNIGLTIIVLSIAVNILILPLYKRADAVQEEERLTQQRLSKGVEHIKKTFSGDERMMILQTYYHMNGYKPTYVVRSAASLLLQIPFFIAAYHFLSNLSALSGASFGPIKDLSAPDGLISAAGITINLLPIVMTLINIISGVIYSNGHPLKAKLQIFAMALIFLVLLYDSPSGLVFYWTLNNLFSLVKNIFYKLKHSGAVINIITSLAGFGLLEAGIADMKIRPDHLTPRQSVFLGLAIALQFPLLIRVLRRFGIIKRKDRSYMPNKALFITGSLFLTLFIGLLIPTNVVRSSPLDFVNIHEYYNPLWYAASALCIASGFFIVWLGVFYILADAKGKVIFEYAVIALCAIAILDYMFFARDLGTLSPDLKYDARMVFSDDQVLTNIAACILAAVVLLLLVWKFKKYMLRIAAVCLIAVAGVSFINIFGISRSLYSVSQMSQTENDSPSFSLSRTGKNVIVIMLDRALGGYVPYMFDEKPELLEKFSGFTYYSNVISYGRTTNFASPALYGGYEYTPTEINTRGEESLREKQNEALKVMPVLFEQNGYDVTVCDPTYANYRNIPDLSIYDDHPDINTYITYGAFSSEYEFERQENNRRNMFCYSLMKSVPLWFQTILYNYGNYHDPSINVIQTPFNEFIAYGQFSYFLDAYNVLDNMPEMTNIENNGNTFMMLSNNTTHNPMLLQAPEYTPLDYVDNTAYETENAGRFSAGEHTLNMRSASDYAHYQSFVAALQKLGEWFDYMRENGVYDNTRIILVGDHGNALGQFDELNIYADDGEYFDASGFFPLFMVKDFYSDGFTVSDEFMTNADTPSTAFEGLIEDPVNPFTGNPVNSDEKTAHDQYIINSVRSSVTENSGNALPSGSWYTIHENIWDKKDWKKIADNAVLTNEDVK